MIKGKFYYWLLPVVSYLLHQEMKEQQNPETHCHLLFKSPVYLFSLLQKLITELLLGSLFLFLKKS